MTDKRDTPVSMSKPGAGSLRASAAARPGTPTGGASRPRTIVATAVALVLSGLFAIAASLTLFGMHAYLVKTARNNQPVPPLTSSQITAQGSQLRTFLQQDLSAHPQLGSTQVAARATDAQNYVQQHLPKSNVSSSDISDQASKLHDAVSSSLGAVTGATLSTQQVTNQATSIAKTYTSNLTTLQGNQPKPLTEAQIQSGASGAPKQYLVMNLVLTVALVFVAMAAWRGRYWARWAVLGIWVLATIGGSFAGISGIFSVAASIPFAFKALYFLASLSLIVAVLSANLRGSTDWFNANRPAGAVQRRGLFGPRPPVRTGAAANGSSAGRTATTRPATSTSAGAERAADRSKSKQRAAAESAAKGAELARTRAKAASKSRRTGT